MPGRFAVRRRASAAPRGAGLADRLLDAAEAIVAADGLEALSLREVARRAGVTHGAPLRHYPSFAALLAEVAARGFRILEDAVEAAATAVPTGAGPTARLAAGTRAYVDCAVKRPGVFALMFRPELVDARHGSLLRDSHSAFEQLVRLVRGAQDAGWRTDHDTRRLAGSLWAAIHGLASLWIHGVYAKVVPDTSLDAALDTTLDLMSVPNAPRTRRRR